MKRLLLAGSIILVAGILSACADEGYYPPSSYYSFSYDDPSYRDYAAHERFHEEFDAAHEAAHERGFNSPEEHEAWHRAYETTHERFHEDHPDAW